VTNGKPDEPTPGNAEQSLTQASWLAGRFSWRSARLWSALILIGILATVLRLVHLDSDAYARLSWSTALLTDEGFYIHNARNVVLFGAARTDDFNNMLIMPTLHAVQVLVFRLFGVGAVQARMISVWSSLLTLPIFFAALRRAFDTRIALTGTLFLALDHANLLYSRLALMDTPASALMICSLYALVRGVQAPNLPGSEDQEQVSRVQNHALCWFFLCGAITGLAYATRGLTALVIPSLVFALWIGTQGATLRVRLRNLFAMACGLALVLVAFLIVWYLPHQSEIVRVNRYYITELLVPHSISRLGLNVARALFDYDRGTMPYLMRHTPVQIAFSILGMSWVIVTRAGSRHGVVTKDGALCNGASAIATVLAGWMTTYIAFLCFVSYAPSRYDVLFYPAMAGLSAFALFNSPRIAAEILERKLAMSVVGSFILALAGQVLRSRLQKIDIPGMTALFWSLTFAFWIGSSLNRRKPSGTRHQHAASEERPEIWLTGLLVWAVVNCYWTGDWILHLSYRQKAADHWLATNLPAGSTLIGAVAPGLCLNNRFRTVNVIVDLCNDGPIVEQFAPPRYIVILDGGAWREHWWDSAYPSLVTPERRIHTFHGMLRSFFDIGVYSVDLPGNPARRLYLRRDPKLPGE